MLNLKSAICPGCAQALPVENTGCTSCGYEDYVAGRILTLEEIIKLPIDDQQRAFNDASPAFIAAVVQAAQQSRDESPMVASGTTMDLAPDTDID
ncbi:zinc ribbon domain-containing protein [Pseudomonas sp. Irchel 3E13]|uniref:zinc ribbon domain-containing protein n=1 Tax=Pseudomonas sp. Irchel 3E13 TaxID=2008975 RepID=UPI0015A7DE86|nr:zinc ribbon domain-containing protein [Pseudomonas sp. Irchel 3E13]